MPWKIPQSVLVVIHTANDEVLLIERADSAGKPSGHWQSVTGSKDHEFETWEETAKREVFEETGWDVDTPGYVLQDWWLENTYDIWPQWRHRYAPEVSRNTERVFGLCLPAPLTPVLSPREHVAWVWLPRLQAAERCFSASNAEAILSLPSWRESMNT